MYGHLKCKECFAQCISEYPLGIEDWSNHQWHSDDFNSPYIVNSISSLKQVLTTELKNGSKELRTIKKASKYLFCLNDSFLQEREKKDKKITSIHSKKNSKNESRPYPFIHKISGTVIAFFLFLKQPTCRQYGKVELEEDISQTFCSHYENAMNLS